MTFLSKHAWEVRDVEPRLARSFIRSHHYSRSCSNTGVYWHGLYRRGGLELLGVAQWLPPHFESARRVLPDNPAAALSLSRLAIADEVPTNGASFLLGRSIRLVRRGGRFRALVTYADTAEGHTGAIYLATNWRPLPALRSSIRWVDAEGRIVAKRSTRNRTAVEMEALGYRRDGSAEKLGFVLYLAPPQRQPERVAQSDLFEVAA